MNIDEFLKELRDSADIQYSIFTEGSCYRLFKILKTIEPSAIAYWSDIDNHTITGIDNKFYDIGGEISRQYLEDKGYYPILESQEKGYSLLKWVDKNTNLSVEVGKYKQYEKNS